MQAKLKEVKEQLRRRRHQPIPEQGKSLRQVVTGHFVYYAVPTNSRALSAFRQHVTDLCEAWWPVRDIQRRRDAT
jgi:RNA-directed DNA polymerase